VGPISAPVLGQIALTLALTAAAYTVVVWALGDRLLARVDPWLAAIVLIGPSTLLLFFLPLQATVGFNLYIGISLLVQAVIRYGGCEILGLPTLFLRRRYAVYCVFNATDLVERRLQGRPRWVTWSLALVVFVITMVLLTLAVSVGDANVERVLYLLFLVVGFVVDRARRATAAPSRT
jgi:hypothetical protein